MLGAHYSHSRPGRNPSFAALSPPKGEGTMPARETSPWRIVSGRPARSPPEAEEDRRSVEPLPPVAGRRPIGRPITPGLRADRKSVAEGRGVSARVESGGRG